MFSVYRFYYRFANKTANLSVFPYFFVKWIEFTQEVRYPFFRKCTVERAGSGGIPTVCATAVMTAPDVYSIRYRMRIMYKKQEE